MNEKQYIEKVKETLIKDFPDVFISFPQNNTTGIFSLMIEMDTFSFREKYRNLLYFDNKQSENREQFREWMQDYINDNFSSKIKIIIWSF